MSKDKGAAGKVAEMVCLAAMREQPSKDWQIATEAACRELGRKVDAAVGTDNDNSGNTNSGYTNYSNSVLGSTNAQEIADYYMYHNRHDTIRHGDD